MKQFWIANDRERGLIKFCEKGELKDSKPFSFDEARAFLISVKPAYAENNNAEKFLKGVASNPFKDWTQF